MLRVTNVLGVLLLVMSTGCVTAEEKITQDEKQPEESVTPAQTEEEPEGSPVHEKEKININTADEELLQELPGIGPVLAARIVDYRKEHGPFEDCSDLKRVKGIGEKKFGKLEELIIVEDAEEKRGQATFSEKGDSPQKK